MPPDIGLVQNRVTIAGFILALLVFVSSVLISFISLAAQAHDQTRKAEILASAPWVYLTAILPIFLGFLLALTSIVFLLQSQTTNKEWLFFLGEILLYLALSQFLSSGLGQFLHVFALALEEQTAIASPIHKYSLLFLVKVLPLLLWWLLLFGAPSIIIYQRNDHRKILFRGYMCALTIIFLCSSLSYSMRSGVTASLFTFIKWLAAQFLQPLFW